MAALRFYGDPVRECTCSPTQVSRYSKRISGPLMDRIDSFVEVPRVDYGKLAGPAEWWGQVRLRTRAARDTIGISYVAEALNYRPARWR
jgi:magnesium chelatase family protein